MVLCQKCKTGEWWDGQTFTLAVEDFVFTGFSPSYLCGDCAKQELEGLYKKCGNGLVANASGDGREELSVNWRLYIQREETEGPLYGPSANLLLCLGVFSRNRVGAWEIVSWHPVGLNPRTKSNGYLYFSQERDGAQYARLKYGNTLYYWELCHYDAVLTKEVILAGKDKPVRA
ncbi:MAG: hypothetical protein Q8R13_04100 [bacterium]|nr:hypothetical protein [bacterium]MDZ4296424.1 hypothetical protein [Patescibacteria group bacterium]